MKSHTGRTLSLRKGAIHANLIKQKLNSCRHTEAELNGLVDEIAKVLLAKRVV